MSQPHLLVELHRPGHPRIPVQVASEIAVSLLTSVPATEMAAKQMEPLAPEIRAVRARSVYKKARAKILFSPKFESN